MSKFYIFTTALGMAVTAVTANAAIVRHCNAQEPSASRFCNTPQRAHPGNAKAPGEDTPQLMTKTPDGEYKVYTRSGSSYCNWGWEAGIADQSSMMAEIVFADDNVVYFRNPICYVNNDVWVKGTIDGDRITLPAGSPLSYDQWNDDYLCIYKATINEKILETDIIGAAAREEGDIIYILNGNTVSLEESDSSLGIGAFHSEAFDWEWAFVDVETVYTQTSLSPVEAPADMTLFTASLVGLNPDHVALDLDNLVGTLVNVGVDGDNLYIQGALSTSPEAWIKGAVSNGKATFENGTFVTLQNGYPVYFTPCSASCEEMPWGAFYTYIPTESSISFDWDAEKKSLTNPSSDFLFSTAVNSSVNMGSWIAPRIKEFNDGAATPKTPAITDAAIHQETEESYIAIAIRTSIFDVEDSMMDASQLYYRVYVDDEPFTFDPSVYTTLSEPMELVPLTFTDNDFFISFGNYQNFYLFDDSVKTVGVQLVYMGGDTETRSDITTWTNEGASVKAVSSGDDDSESKVYDLTGREINKTSLTPGIYVKKGHKFVVR